MKNTFILYYIFKKPIEYLFINVITNIQDKLIDNNYEMIIFPLKSVIIQTSEEVNSLKLIFLKYSLIDLNIIIFSKKNYYIKSHL